MIPDLRHLDQVINIDGPVRYPSNMPVFTTQKWSLNWEFDHGHNVNLSAHGGTSTGLVQAQADAAIAFKRSINNYWNFESLDTSIIQPTLPYIEDSLESEFVQKFVEGGNVLPINYWTLYMVSGLIIARGATNKHQDINEGGVHGKGEVKALGETEAGAKLFVLSKSENALSYGKASDFVWAVRLTKISKGLFASRLNRETVGKGATFGLGENDEAPIDVMARLAAEGVEPGHLTSFGDGENVFIIVDYDTKDEE